MRHSRSALAFLFLAASLARAPAEDFDPTRFVGLDLPSAYAALGAPQEVFSFRGAQASQDNVVFYYPGFLYLFWYQNRVWQVRVDRRFARTVFGLSLGMSAEDVGLTVLRSVVPMGDSLYFDIDDGRYPLRVRLVIAGGVLSDLYVYRSDF